MRPKRLVLVTGTGTEVGKTWVAAGALQLLRTAGVSVAARKPAQSFDATEPGDAGAPPGTASWTEPTDAERLAAVTGEDVAVICPPHRSYPLALAPPMAARSLGLAPPTIGQLAAEVSASWPAGVVDVGVVEAAGGVAAPQGDDGDAVDLATALDVDLVVVVGHPGLGTINHIRLSVRALRSWPVAVYLNRFQPDDDLHRRNRDWLAERDGYLIITELASLAERMVGDGGPADLRRGGLVALDD